LGLASARFLKINAAIYGILTRVPTVRELTEMLSLHGKLNQPVRKLWRTYEGRTPGSTPAPTPGTVLDEPTLGLDVNARGARIPARVQPAIWSHSTLTSHYMADITPLPAGAGDPPGTADLRWQLRRAD